MTFKIKLRPRKRWPVNYYRYPFGDFNVKTVPHSLKPQKPDVFDEEFVVQEKTPPASSSVSLSFDTRRYLPIEDTVHYESVVRESKVVPTLEEIKKYSNINNLTILENIQNYLWEEYFLGNIKTKNDAIDYILTYVRR